jgi:eukaryotic-like serine/threonine-protein kinase
MHRPVPPLPDDVPAPVAALVTNMLAKQPEDRPQSARWVADRARQLRSGMPASPDLVAEAALGAGAEELSSEVAAEAVTDPGLGASLTRADLGAAALTGAGFDGQPDDNGRSPGDHRYRRRSAFLAAAVSVAVAAIGGTVAAVMLSGHPMSTTGDTSPASPAAASPAVSGNGAAPASTGPTQIRVPAGILPTTPNLGVAGNGTMLPTAKAAKKPGPVKSTKPATPPTAAPPTTAPPTTAPPTTAPPTTAPPTTGTTGGGASSTNVIGSQ